MVVAAERGKDLSGKSYGDLTVVGDTGKRTGQRGKVYLVKNKKGEYLEMQSINLTRNQATGYRKSDEGRQKSRDSMNKLNENRDKYIKKRGFIDDTNINHLQMKTPKTNTSGYKGVSFLPKKPGKQKHDKWRAYIFFQGKQINLGRFDTKEEAINARLEAEGKYFKPILEKYNQTKGDY